MDCAGGVAQYFRRTMITAASVVPAAGIFKRPSVRETTVLLALAWLVPFLIHLVPWAGARPLGVYLLPAFWTAFVAVYLYGLGIGLLVALFAPALNLVLTGLPALAWLAMMSWELTVFVLLTWWAVRKFPGWWVIAPAGYIGAKLSATLLQMALGNTNHAGLAGLASSFRNGLAGLAMLAAVNFALTKLYAKRPEATGGVNFTGH